MQRERRPQKQQGVNWGLIFGGAVATVLSVAFSRSNKKKKNVDPDTLSLRRESSSGSSSSKSDISDGAEILSVFNRTAVHKLRHQLKSRDQMIMDMQSRLTDKERALFSHKSLIANLEKQLKVANRSIYEVERVIQELRKNETPVTDSPRSEEQDGEQMVVRDDVDGGDKKSLVVHAKERDYGLVFERAKHLEAELVGIRAMAQEMASLLEMSERERLRLHQVVSQLQQKLAFQAKELSTMRATTHFLKLSLESRRSGNGTEAVESRLSHEEDGLIQIDGSSMNSELTFDKAQRRYAAVSESVEKDTSGKEDNSTSSSASSYPEFSDGTEWSVGGQGEVVDETRQRIVANYNNNNNNNINNGFRSEDSPGAVRIGSPTIAGSRSVDGLGLAARRYLFDNTRTTANQQDEDEAAAFSSLGVVVEELKSTTSSSSVTDEMLDDTLDDLIKATTPTAVSLDASVV